MTALRVLGGSVLAVLELIGGLAIFFKQVLRSLVPARYDVRETWRAFYKVGVKSYAIVIMTATFTGAIMVIQAGQFVAKTQADSFVGWAAGFTVLAEIGPVLIGLMFSGRVGANNTAELGTMVVTEQVDALRALSIDPLNYLAVPRFLAMIVMLFLLTALGDLFALLGGGLTAELMINVPFEVFIQQVIDADLADEYVLGLVKGSVFGMSIAIVSCYFGFGVKGGATGVGRAVNNSVVVSAIGIFVTDFCVGLIWHMAQ
ncbi:MAG: phospholipid/cholesterol/gamma-HCH transport system permease protein [Myxococcota bacterium]|jgi:phospholipid/cholesterol/gamma-HCH transport system permease protein